jgi:uncharacterized protein (UPF0332 family)
MVKVRVKKRGVKIFDTKYRQYAGYGETIYVKKEEAEEGIKKGDFEAAP